MRKAKAEKHISTRQPGRLPWINSDGDPVTSDHHYITTVGGCDIVTIDDGRCIVVIMPGGRYTDWHLYYPHIDRVGDTNFNSRVPESVRDYIKAYLLIMS